MYNLEEPSSKNKVYENDEIDLRVIFNWISNGFAKIGRGINYLFYVIRKRIILLSIFSIVGISIGFALYKVTKPYYTSSMTLVLANIRNEFVDDQLRKLSEMIKDDNFAAISQKLDINEEAAKQIKGMEFSNLDENRINEDSILTGSPFRIELKLYDNALFSLLEPALANYLENNRYFYKQKLIKQRQVQSVIGKLRDEIKSIDSLKTTVARPRGPVNGFVYGEALDPTSLYRESVGMFKEQARLEAQLDQLDNIQVVTGFSPRSKPSGPRLLRHLVAGGVVFFIFGLIYVFRKEKKL